jgi:hypothetical protein
MTPSWTSARETSKTLKPRMSAFEMRSTDISGATTGRTPGMPLDSGANELWARREHTHKQPGLPRWVRYLAVLVAVLVLLTGGLAWVVGVQAARIDALESYVADRRTELEQQRKEDLQRERLLICDALLSLQVRSPSVQGLLGRLECPPPGDPAYHVLGEPPYNE